MVAATAAAIDEVRLRAGSFAVARFVLAGIWQKAAGY
jgi:hypothetical protein